MQVKIKCIECKGSGSVLSDPAQKIVDANVMHACGMRCGVCQGAAMGSYALKHGARRTAECAACDGKGFVMAESFT